MNILNTIDYLLLLFFMYIPLHSALHSPSSPQIARIIYLYLTLECVIYVATPFPLEFKNQRESISKDIHVDLVLSKSKENIKNFTTRKNLTKRYNKLENEIIADFKIKFKKIPLFLKKKEKFFKNRTNNNNTNKSIIADLIIKLRPLSEYDDENMLNRLNRSLFSTNDSIHNNGRILFEIDENNPNLDDDDNGGVFIKEDISNGNDNKKYDDKSISNKLYEDDVEEKYLPSQTEMMTPTTSIVDIEPKITIINTSSFFAVDTTTPSYTQSTTTEIITTLPITTTTTSKTISYPDNPQFVECINSCGTDHDCVRTKCLSDSTYFG
ncbi:unnamed protein product [Brachionus calyciflorus]|uniref:Uncharacterized protein n=1 Tax=Brachionus calyciflorus TaxID=104777 RepID=A0A813UAC8_9BILA|nr:unnamed protein product [Brachionus calyciflorus]